MEGSRVRVIFSDVCKLTLPVLLGISYVDIFAKSFFLPERKIVLYNSTPEPIFAIEVMPE